jgi:hypothetical protein
MDSANVGRSAADDRQAIAQQIYLYCRAMDRMDVSLGYSIWHEDGEADYGEAIFQGSGYGFIDFVNGSHADTHAHSHQVTNLIIILDGDRASSESYVTAALRIMDGKVEKQLTVRGRYLDGWSYRAGRWAIDKRVFVHDFDDVRIVQPTGAPSGGARDTSDPSYAVLGLQT